MRPKILFVTRTSPFAGDSGSGSYGFSLLHYLAKAGWDIHVIWTEAPDTNLRNGWYTPPPDGKQVFSLQVVGMIRVGSRFWKPDFVWLPLKANALHWIKTALKAMRLWQLRRPKAESSSNLPTSAPTSLDWGAATSPAEKIYVRRAMARQRPVLVLANYSWMGPAVRDQRGGRPPLALLTHDVRHRKITLINGVATECLGEFLDPRVETEQLGVADLLIAIQNNEAAYFRKLLPDLPIITATMHAVPCEQQAVNLPTVLVVGSGNAENVRGLRWFMEKAWPLVLVRHPNARFLVAGTICEHLPPELVEGVTLMGRLARMSEAYARAAIVVAPVLSGSGVKIKVLESVAHGRACVTTSAGIDGLEFLLPHILVADDAEQFADAVSLLLSDLSGADQRGRAALAVAREKLSAEACYAPLHNALKNLIQ